MRPLTDVERIIRYAKQPNTSRRLTARQLRRINRKANRAEKRAAATVTAGRSRP